MEIDCLSCGKTIKIPDFIDTNNYDGQVTCQECKSLLHIKLGGGKVRKYEVVERKGAGSNLNREHACPQNGRGGGGCGEHRQIQPPAGLPGNL